MPPKLSPHEPEFGLPQEDPADPGQDAKRRARWRFIGALLFAAVVAAGSFQLLLQDPRPLSQDFLVVMPMAQSPAPVLTQEEADALVHDAPETPLTLPALTPANPLTQSPSVSGTLPSTTGKTPPPARPPAPSGVSRAWFVQLGAYSSRDAADKLATRVNALGYSASVSRAITKDGERFRVQVGPFSEGQARAYFEKVRAQGYAPLLIRPQ